MACDVRQRALPSRARQPRQPRRPSPRQSRQRARGRPPIRLRSSCQPRHDITADTPLDGAIPADSKRRVSELAPARVQSSIERALRILAARRAAGGRGEHELQAVVQVCPAGEHYARWRKDRNRIMQRSSKRWGARFGGTVDEDGRGGDLRGDERGADPAGGVGQQHDRDFVGRPVARASCECPAVELLAIQLVRPFLPRPTSTSVTVPRNATGPSGGSLPQPRLDALPLRPGSRRRVVSCGDGEHCRPETDLQHAPRTTPPRHIRRRRICVPRA